MSPRPPRMGFNSGTHPKISLLLFTALFPAVRSSTKSDWCVLDMKGKIQTVCGWIDPGILGKTLTHEHLVADFYCYWSDPPQHAPRPDTLSFTVENLGFIRQYPYSFSENLSLHGEENHMVEELKLFRKNGGSSIVECTTLGLNRDVGKLKQISMETGVNVICGAGYFTANTHPSNMDRITQEQLVSTLVHDITQGADGTDVRCGVIGEIGCSWPLTDNERKVVQATAAAQSETGCPVIIHPGGHTDAPYEIVRILQEAGGDISSTVMSHIDSTFFEPEDLLEFASLGCYLEWDFFGLEVSHTQWQDIDMPNDAMRIRMIRQVLEEGHADRVVISHDVDTKHRLMHYGGHGYSHILLNVVPKMRNRGISEEDINKILIENPKRWLVFK
ncbi:N-acetyltaurine hydrolase-like [Branchiostoma floridae x Branchiostoma belcheri]